MFLNNDKKLFREVIFSTAEELGMAVPIVEKDYYVTMILKELSKKYPECVFKGGGHHYQSVIMLLNDFLKILILRFQII